MDSLSFKLAHRMRDPLGVAYNNFEKLQNGYVLPANTISSATGKASRELVNVGNFNTYNGGDALLSVVIRDYFDERAGRSKWRKIHAHKPVTKKVIDRINASDGLVIGGGGLFLVDTNLESKSGWQWGIAVDDLKKIEVPISVFAVGYNKFRGQSEFPSVFRDSMNELVSRADFFGLRNNGSIEAVKSYLDPSLQDKVQYQPCLTTFLRLVYPDLFLTNVCRKDVIAVNIAFDRPQLRFGDDLAATMKKLCSILLRLSENHQIELVSHAPEDEKFLAYANDEGVKFKHVQMYRKPGVKLIEYYRDVPITIGMRGHAQMIPFGCGNAIISLVSHNKLRWFLEDNGIDEFAVELNCSDLEGELLAAVSKVSCNIDHIRRRFLEKMGGLKSITDTNIQSHTFV